MGLFVTFEGPEGAGKSSVIAELSNRLLLTGRRFVTTREPGAGEVGGRIREILLGGVELDAATELFLFLADRSHHVSRIVRPALERGEIVLCDRHADSTVVYQGFARGLGVERLREWNLFATGGLKPDLTILLDVDPEIGLSRQHKRDRLDSEPLAFHQMVRTGFLEESRMEPERWVVVDASNPLDEVVGRCWSALESRLGPV